MIGYEDPCYHTYVEVDEMLPTNPPRKARRCSKCSRMAYYPEMSSKNNGLEWKKETTGEMLGEIDGCRILISRAAIELNVGEIPKFVIEFIINKNTYDINNNEDMMEFFKEFVFEKYCIKFEKIPKNE